MILNSESVSSSEMIIAYAQLFSASEIECKNPQQITKLSIMHSKLESLSGIQNFTSLVSLNLKYNHIKDYHELSRLPSREALRELNIEGNPIEHLSACTYLGLRKLGFHSLLLFNNRDYSRWGNKTKKVDSITKMHNKLGEVGKEMQRTLKRTIRNNVIEKYKLSHQELQPIDDEQTSRQQYQKQKSGSSNERTPLREISLSNVNMIKSAKIQQMSGQQKTKIPQLMIETVEFGMEDQIVNMPLTQPTATFASQKQKEAMPFKGRTNYFPNQVNAISEIDDHYYTGGTEDEDLYEMSYSHSNAYQSFSRVRHVQNKTVLEEEYDSAHEKGLCLAEGYHLRNLGLKVLKALRPKNMPRRVSYV